MAGLDLLRPSVVFATVVEEGSFRAAAEKLGLSQPYVSQLVSDLEARLGKQLLYRSTRKLSTTDQGELYLRHALGMRQAFYSGIDAVKDRHGALSGRLKISAPTLLAAPRFARLVARFAADNPGLNLDVRLEDGIADVIDDKIDLTLRIGGTQDDTRRAWLISTTRQILVAGPAWRGELRSPADLRDVTWLAQPTMPNTVRLTGDNGKRRSFGPPHRLVVNNAALIRLMLTEQKSVALLPEFSVQEALGSGTLVHVLPDWSIPNVAFHALYTEKRTALTNARAFVDALKAEITGTRAD